MATDTNIAKTATYAEWVIPVTTVATVFVMLVPVPALFSTCSWPRA